MKRGIIFIMFCTIVNMAVCAQQPDTTVVFSKLVHDFGAIAKTDGEQTYSFEFTNKSPNPVTINNVTTSCGCTTSGWTKEPVVSGGKGYVNVTYKPSGVAKFTKTVTVNIGGGKPEVIVLRIQGNVVDGR